MRTMKTEPKASMLTLDVRMDNMSGESAQIQKGNNANIKELWYAVQELEKKDISREIDNRVKIQITDLREKVEAKKTEPLGLKTKSTDNWGRRLGNRSEGAENIESRLTAVEVSTHAMMWWVIGEEHWGHEVRASKIWDELISTKGWPGPQTGSHNPTKEKKSAIEEPKRN